MRKVQLLLIHIWCVELFSLSNAYLSFEHPEGWQCELSQAVWICQSGLEIEKKESLVMTVATVATDWDTLENYEKYLKTPKTIQNEDGSTLKSEVKFSTKKNINGFSWVDSLHFNSELPDFYTRYTATVQNQLAILVTYVVSKEFYKDTAPKFNRMIATLKPNADFNLNAPSKQGDGPIPGREKLGPPDTSAILKNRLKQKDKDVKPPTSDPIVTFVLIGAVAGVGYFIFFRKKKKKRRTQGSFTRKVG